MPADAEIADPYGAEKADAGWWQQKAITTSWIAGRQFYQLGWANRS